MGSLFLISSFAATFAMKSDLDRNHFMPFH